MQGGWNDTFSFQPSRGVVDLSDGVVMEQGLVDQALLWNCAVLDGEAPEPSACLSL